MKRLVLACVLASFVSIPYASAGVIVLYKSGNAGKVTVANPNTSMAASTL